MRNAYKIATSALLVSSLLACQSQTKMGGSAQKAPEKKPIRKNAELGCLGILNADDLAAPQQLVRLWRYTFNSEAEFKAGQRSWWGLTGIIIGPNAILSIDGDWPGDPNPGSIKIQLSNDSDSSSEHLAGLPEVETVIFHPSLGNKAVAQSPASTGAEKPSSQGAKADSQENSDWGYLSKRVVILKSRLANLPKYFTVSEKRRLPGDQVTLIGVGDRIDIDYDTAGKIGPAIGTNSLIDTALLPQQFAWLKNDSVYLIGGRRNTVNNTSKTDSMPTHGDGGSAMVQGNTLVGLNLTVDRHDMRGVLGKESLAIYLDLSSKFAQELVSAAIEKKAEVVKENDKADAPECKAS